MKLLLDEHIPHQLRRYLPNHDVFTVSYMGWKGIENGELLALATAEGFDALLTKDAAISYQQNITTLPCAVVVLVSASNSIATILPLLPELLRQLETLMPCSLVYVRG